MNTGALFCILACALFMGTAPLTASAHKPQRLLAILLDGFRFDYLNQSNVALPGFEKMARLGVKVGGLTPAFPSLSFPNYYSIMTGLYTESHGITENNMYDVTRNESFLLESNPERKHSHWWDGAEPLWITTTRKGLSSHMYYWPGCDILIRGMQATVCHQYTRIPSFGDFTFAINDSLALLQSGRADLAGIYFEQVDAMGHLHGPFSEPVNKVILDLDAIMSDLADRLSEPAMSEVNVMIFSDHGMAEVSADRVVNISSALDPADYHTVLDFGALTNIYTLPGKDQQVFNKLRSFHSNLSVFLRSDFPERWHYKHGRNVAPVTVVADLGWFIATEYFLNKNKSYLGWHGYDNIQSEMQGIFLGMGPAFKPGQTLERISILDLYPIMCNILGVQPNPNNGSFSDIVTLLNDDEDSTSYLTWWTLLLTLFVCFVYLM